MQDKKISDDHLCFCGSGQKFGHCCQPVIEGKHPAASAEALMRSRYSAYVLENDGYLRTSWHPDTCPDDLHIQPGVIRWQNLEVRKTHAGQAGDTSGRVEFVAHYQQQGIPGKVHEESRFVFEHNRWWYVDGVMKTDARVGRNDPCPCGSGKKYKKCCAA